MKPLTFILGMGLFFLTAGLANSQDCTEAVKSKKAIYVIGENDYPNFLTVEGLKNYSNIKFNMLNYYVSSENSSRVRSYILQGQGKDIEIYADYNKDGKLKKGKLVMKNALLPKSIYSFLSTSNYKNSTVTGNKTFVSNFDAKTTEYAVKIRQNNVTKTLFFNHDGKQIEKLSRQSIIL